MKTLIRFLLLAAAIAVAAGLLWYVPQWQTAPWQAFLTARDLLELQNQVRQTVALLLAVAAGLGGLALIWRRLAASERRTLEALQAGEESRRLERFTRAVGQLAEAHLEVRLGAIYGLEQLAAESMPQRGPIIEVLCAFVRERAGWDAERAAATRLPTDVQAVLSVIGRRAVAREGGAAPRVDLRRTDLRGADLNGVHLTHANLFEAHLEHATLQGAHLAGADLRGAHLQNADLVEADLRGADLREAHLESAYMVEAHLEGADLGGAHLAGVYLGSAHLQGADLGGAHLDGAYLYKANLEGASLHGARVMSSIGVHRDERERINRTAAAEPAVARIAKGSPPAEAARSLGPDPETPASRPTPLRQAKR
ncbi:MAG: pentapeptide repeat-containing protein [bacterium]